MAFLPVSGLGLRETCLEGTGSSGGGPSEVVELLGRLDRRSLEPTPLDGRGGIGGLDGSAGLALGRSWYCMGGIESSPNHPEAVGCCEAPVPFPLSAGLRLDSDLLSFSASFLLWFSASRRSTRSRHCNSNCFRESKRAFSVSDRAT